MENQNAEYGEVVFPIVDEVSDPDHEDCYASLISKRKIRERYYLEIRNILNGRIDDTRFDYKNYFHFNFEEDFMKDYRHIKGDFERRRGSNFEWLNLKVAKRIIKRWEGEPLGVLYYLAYKGIIEKAVAKIAKRRGTK